MKLGMCQVPPASGDVTWLQLLGPPAERCRESLLLSRGVSTKFYTA